MRATAFLAALLLMSCDAVDSVKEGFDHTKAVSTELEKSLGTKAFVGFNWHNGSLTSVNVTFDGIPKDRSLTEIADLSRAAVRREFKQEPKQIVVAFSLKP